MDIIKSAGYKLSALMIESAILEHPGVAEVAVLGVPDDVYGEVVTAVVVPENQVVKKGDTFVLVADESIRIESPAHKMSKSR